MSLPSRSTGVGHSPARTSSYAALRPIPSILPAVGRSTTVGNLRASSRFTTDRLPEHGIAEPRHLYRLRAPAHGTAATDTASLPEATDVAWPSTVGRGDVTCRLTAERSAFRRSGALDGLRQARPRLRELAPSKHCLRVPMLLAVTHASQDLPCRSPGRHNTGFAGQKCPPLCGAVIAGRLNRILWATCTPPLGLCLRTSYQRTGVWAPNLRLQQGGGMPVLACVSNAALRLLLPRIGESSLDDRESGRTTHPLGEGT
jgi:hypothetical protein